MKEWMKFMDGEIEKFRRVFTFMSFREAMEFVNGVAELSERQNHHPDIFIRYNKVEIQAYTHSSKGITAQDEKLVAGIEELVKSLPVHVM